MSLLKRYPIWRSRPAVARHFQNGLLLAGAVLLGMSVPVAAAEGSNKRDDWFGGGVAGRWAYGAEIYLWGASVGGETTSGNSVDVKFNDLIKNLKLGFMGAFGATRDKWTLFADLIYLDVEDNTKSTVSVLGNPVRTKVDLTLKGFITTFGGAYRFLETDTTRLNVLAGARYLWLETDLDLNLDLDDLGLSASGSESGYLWDGIVGLRGKTNLNEKWYLTYYADVGTGNSEITWQALGAVNYRFQRFDASLGYRYAEWRVDDGALLNFEKLDLHGPFLGLKFRF
jgi:hypothetical protein